MANSARSLLDHIEPGSASDDGSEGGDGGDGGDGGGM